MILDLKGMPTGKTRLAGVIGWPVDHSLSPRLHGFWLRHYGIDGAYLPLAVQPDDFGAALKALPKLGFKGANITVPHKEEAFRHIDELDDFACRAGAVNTIIVAKDGHIIGRNTDGFGFIENLKQGHPGWQAAAGPAVVIGAGGAARAIVAALLDAGVPEIRLVNRTRSRAEDLAAAINMKRISVHNWDQRSAVLDGAALLVNTSILGMSGKAPLDLQLDDLPEKALVTDIVYAPLETGLLKGAVARGNPVVDGIGMLLHQARPGFAAWFGTAPEVTPDLRDFVLRG